MRTKARRTAAKRALSLALVVLLTAVLMLSAKPAHARDFTVLNTNDSGSGSLRRVIDLANLTPGADAIKFAIPGDGVKTIRPTSELPAITEQVTIDGYSQPGSAANTLDEGTNAKLKVRLDGSNAQGSFVDGLDIAAGNVVVRGLVISNFGDDGIDVTAATGVRIEGNFIGTDVSGTLDRGNGDNGIFIDRISGSTFGGAAPEARNLISGNGQDGVVLFAATKDTRVEGNLIGTKKDGETPLGNGEDGVDIINSSGNLVGGSSSSTANTIAFNGGNGVNVVSSFAGLDGTGNRILANSIFSNGALGIDLVGGTENAAGATANDLGDVDAGSNDLQNKPVLTAATISSGTTFVSGRLNSTPGEVFEIHFYSNPSGDEGKRFVGIESIITDASGDASFTGPVASVAAGQKITATATGVTIDSTSEFSAPRTVVAQ